MDYDYDDDDDTFDVPDDGMEDAGGWDDEDEDDYQEEIYISDDDDDDDQVHDEAEVEAEIEEQEEEEEEDDEDDEEQHEEDEELEDYVEEDEPVYEEEEEEEEEEEGVEDEENEEQEEDYVEEEEEEPETLAQSWRDWVSDDEDDDYEDYITPIPSSTIRVSSNPSSATSVQPQQQLQQNQEEEREIGTIPQIAAENVLEIERTAQGNDQRRREEGESSSSRNKGIGNLGITSKRGELSTDGVCCSICMEPWSSEGDHQVSCLPCGHVYGLSCIKTWVQRSSYSKCPQCNKQCRLEDIIMLYVPRLVVADGEQQKKILSLQAENDFLKMKFKGEWEELNRIMSEMNRDHEEKYKRLAEQIEDMKTLIKRNVDKTLKRQDE